MDTNEPGPGVYPETVAQVRRVAGCSRRSTARYRSDVTEPDDAPASEWSRYLREATDREGWSVARLAREAEINRATIFRWMSGGGERVTIESVRRIADALGDDLDVVLRAAGGLPEREDANGDEEIDFEIRMIEQSSLPDPQKRAMVDFARQLQRRQQAERAQIRERQRAERRNSLQAMIDLAQGGNTNPAT